MEDKEKAKQEVEKIVKKFQSYDKKELDSMPEEQIKFRFIEPLFEILGWEREDIFKEKRILKGRADYIMKIGNQNKLVIEAKKTSVRLSEDEGRQAVSYAHHKNIKFSVLTNFKQIRVYHALSNLKNIDKNLLKDEQGYFWLDCEDFVKEFDRLWLLSKESFKNEEINKLLKNVDKRLIKPIDEVILNDLLQFRGWLSKDLKSKRTYLTKEQIDEVVQILIDRLIFMRSVEDRGLEGKDFLLTIIGEVQKGFTDRNLWALLKTQFERFDKTYNSKLFAEGLLENEGFFDEKIMIKVIKGLYYGTQDHQERYMFDEIPVDLLGSIYEQYLGVVLRGTEKRVKLDLASGKRKKMGIYYTPSHIVDYIVKNTIKEYCKDKSIDEILEIKIVDPACGSGSFLIDAFQELCNIVGDRLNKGEKSRKWSSFNSHNGRLSIGQKTTILLNCIYGVDLDEKAVELAQLNLLLKILEEETRETRKRLLPNMKDNIRNGNSLISDSKYDKSFNWNAQDKFKDIMRSGGFDIVIGNPPYFSVVTFNKKDSEFFKKEYGSSKGQYNIYNLFIEKGVKLLKPLGKLGFITQNTFLIGTDYFAIRKFLLDAVSINKIVDLGGDVFKDANVTTCITILTKQQDKNNQIEIHKKIDDVGFKINQNSFRNNKGFSFNIYAGEEDSKILEKVEQNSKKISELFYIMRGIETISKEKISDKENSKSKKILLGKQNIKRYKINSYKFLEYNSKHKNRYKNEEILNAKKIIIPEGASNLLLVYDDEGYWITRSLYALISDRIDLKIACAILNSKLYAYYVNKKIKGNVGYTKIRIAHVKELPLKLPSEKQAKRINELVDRMIKFCREGESEQQIKNVDYEIDEEIYKLYGITDKERQVIEQS